MAIEIVKRHLTLNPCYVNNVNKVDSRYGNFQKNGPQGGVLHSVGCAQPSAEVFITKWNKPDYNNACVHGFIDANTGVGYETLPMNYRGWHGASGANGSVNDTHIGIEMCESKYIRYLKEGEAGYAPAKFVILDKAKAQADCTRAYQTAVYWFAKLAIEWGWNVDTDILSHKEAGKKGIASGHVDPEHYWTGLSMPYTMNGFRADVKQAMAQMQNPFVDVKEGRYYYESVLWAVENGITNGTDSTHFSPDENCTRGQIVTMLKRYHDKFGGV